MTNLYNLYNSYIVGREPEGSLGAITVQICSIENQKGAIALEIVQW